MSTNRPRHKHIDDVERLDYYEQARDEQLSKYIAVKVGAASSNHKEIDILNRLANHPAGERCLGRVRFPPVLDRFNVHGPNGTHPCFVTVPAMSSLAVRTPAEPPRACQAKGLARELRARRERIYRLRRAPQAAEGQNSDTNVARSIPAHLAMAVAHMHSVRCVHSDRHLGNLLLQNTGRDR
ncbi:protein kinase domain-containing protein [Verticillium alfalfae VaMs.102]|uniref:Protein kinase domain-containing protein n=1 Tax=Verticillium alfalfae (strain VaMs.102 / ATCC MYA-4576 / FGSC 10136) TaxID=526221 RepID=C9SER1_VERA1|nr:protein kinase domain-containing protein [Verticillium alfalfae VaMs.102]EEY16654.1 protein kinase domain-containing protein [Verticillium alfalfae VaMs.102]